MSKYEPLGIYLMSIPHAMSEITLSFAQLEELLRTRLPASAFDYRAWWSNEEIDGRHVQSHAWLSAGFVVDAVSPKRHGGWVRFKRQS